MMGMNFEQVKNILSDIKKDIREIDGLAEAICAINNPDCANSYSGSKGRRYGKSTFNNPYGMMMVPQNGMMHPNGMMILPNMMMPHNGMMMLPNMTMHPNGMSKFNKKG